MAAQPVVSRELLAEARRPFNYWLRVLTAGFVGFAFTTMIFEGGGVLMDRGAFLFNELNSVLFYSILILVPIMTADCLSREKREGTLGLLFLTPLTARDIILGKMITHGLRAFTLVLSALPLMALPSVLGGVTWKSAIQSMVLHLSALIFSLAAGFWASARHTEWVRAVVAAELLVVGFLFVFHASLLRISRFQFLGLEYFILAMIFFVGVLQGSASRLRDRWQTELTEPPEPGWVKLFSTSEFWQAAFRWNKRRTLDRNPVAWLQEYSWTARLTKWGWFGLILVAEVLVMFNFRIFDFFAWQVRLALAVALGMAFSAAWSFRREREMGALELLLVTPLQAWHLIGGRIWGLWCHFFPAVALLLFLWIYNPFYMPRRHIWMFWSFCASFLTLPIIGLHFSLTRLHFLVSWLLTGAIAVWLPYLFVSYFARYARRYSAMAIAPHWFVIVVQLGLAVLACALLYRNLSRRDFAVEKTK
jgi:ABC-type transport system involved in multi-copper enzyme maturation permease subunit